jgi:hypothetical protein
MLPAQTLPGRKAIAFSLLLALFVSACSTPPPSVPVSVPTPIATPAAPSATVPPSAPVEEHVAVPVPTVPVTPAIDPAAAPVVARLAKQLRVSAEEIIVAQVTHAEWPNACLGLAAEGEICAQVMTPGFAVSLIVRDQRYDFRTDQTGRRIRLAFAPLLETGEALVTWKDTGSFSFLVIGTERVAFGLRGGPRLVAPPPLPGRTTELLQFVSRFAPFYARTPAGEITFRGMGPVAASAVEQRQVAEWAGLVAQEAELGLTRPADDRAFVWRREGGIAGFCDEVIVSRAGDASAWSCRMQQDTPSASVTLATAELQQLYQWLDSFAPFSWEDDGGGLADAMTISLDLAGQGTRPLTEPERERMLEFANSLVRRLLTESQF